MAKVYTDDANYSAIADAIRAQGVSGTFMPGEMAAAIASIESGSTASLVARGTFSAGSGASYVDVTFGTPLDGAPTLIIFWEATTSYATTARTKGGIGMSERMNHYGTSNTTYYQRRWYGSASNSLSASNSSASITASNGLNIRNAKATGFRAYQYSASYKLYGTYNYIAVYAPA